MARLYRPHPAERPNWPAPSIRRDRQLRQFIDTHQYFGIQPTFDISQPGTY